MKHFILWVFLLGTPVAFAESSDGFKYFTAHCKSTVHNGVESSPQSPPLLIDDPATPGCNTWEINVVFSGELTSSEKVFQAPLLDINYGIGDNLQLKYEIARTLNQSKLTQETNFSYSKLGFKYLFFENDTSKLQISIYPQLEFTNPLEGLAETFRASSAITWPLLLAKKIAESEQGDIILAVNLGYTKSLSADTRDSGFFRLGLGIPVLRSVSWMSEVGTVRNLIQSPPDQENLLQVNTGVLVGLSNSIQFYASCGQEISNAAGKNFTSILAGFRFISR